MKRSQENKLYDLDALFDTYNIDNPYEQYKRLEFVEKLKNYIKLKAATILELGCASGQMTKILAGMAKNVVAIEGSVRFAKITKERLRNEKNVKIIVSLFEDFYINQKFDCVICHHVLEHLENPSIVLQRIKSHMKRNAMLAVSVPNAYALSRQLAVKMGLLSSVYELTENDRHHGHYRVYDWKKLEEELTGNGFTIIGKRGLSFKLFSDKQNIEILNANIIGEEQIRGLWQLADDFPEFSGAIMMVAKKF